LGDFEGVLTSVAYYLGVTQQCHHLITDPILFVGDLMGPVTNRYTQATGYCNLVLAYKRTHNLSKAFAAYYKGLIGVHMEVMSPCMQNLWFNSFMLVSDN